jgi:predicted nuclease of predicted toxin-antitoxin system
LKIFLDHCIPKRLLRLLSEHEVKTAYQMGWAAKKNGELLKLVARDFEVFITVDQNLRHQQNLASSSLKFIVLVAANNQYDSLALLIPQVKAELTKLLPGDVIEIS